MDNEIVIYMHFELLDNTEQNRIAQLIQERLNQLDSVSEAEAIPEEPRGVAEILAMIAVTVLLVKGSRELIEELRKLVQEIKGLIVDIQELKEVWIEVGEERLSLDQVEQLSDDEFLANFDEEE